MNATGIVLVIVEQTKKMICLENNINMMKILLVLRTCRFSTLKKISSYLQNVVSYKSTRYQNVYVY